MGWIKEVRNILRIIRKIFFEGNSIFPEYFAKFWPFGTVTPLSP